MGLITVDTRVAISRLVCPPAGDCSAVAAITGVQDLISASTDILGLSHVPLLILTKYVVDVDSGGVLKVLPVSPAIGLPPVDTVYHRY